MLGISLDPTVRAVPAATTTPSDLYHPTHPRLTSLTGGDKATMSSRARQNLTGFDPQKFANAAKHAANDPWARQ